VHGLRCCDELVDLRLVIDAFAEGVRPERAELTGCRRRSDRRKIGRKYGEQAGQIPKDGGERG
jgi:hypothetical protein